MQCHNCQYNGKGNEICLSCKSADYLDNDFKTVSPVGDISEVQKNIDTNYLYNKQSKPLINFSADKTPQNLEDCENVLKELKKCHYSSFKHIACIVTLFLSVGIHTPLLVSVLNGESFSDYAKQKNVSKQSVQQLWNRLVKNNNLLIDIKKKNVNHKQINKNNQNIKTKKKKTDED